MKELLEKLSNRLPLSSKEAYSLLYGITDGTADPHQVAAFLGIFRTRAITVDELAGFRKAMLELAPPVDLSDFDPVDLCGTGGDGKDTFNISTLAAFVVAGCGVKVGKHGNYGVSSVCGSSNVLEHLGVNFPRTGDELRRDMEKAGICFMHAPFFHPAMKNVGPVRRALGFRTFFNLLGPLVNPARPRRQLIGVMNLETQRLFAYLMQREEMRFATVTSLDGYDEISLTGPFKVISSEGEQTYLPEALSLPRVDAGMLSAGGSVEEAGKIFMNVLSGKGTQAQRAVTAANAALALTCALPECPLENALPMAFDSLDSGKGMEVFQRLVG